MKKVKGIKNAHTANTSNGMGDHYGSAIKNPVGRIRDGLGYKTINAKKEKSAPKALA